MSINEAKVDALRSLELYREKLVGQIQHIDHIVESLGGSPLSRPPISVSTRYKGLKPQAAARLFLVDHPNEWFKASVLTKELLNREVVKTSKAFGTAVQAALNRLVEKGFAIREKQNGVFSYQFKDSQKSSFDEVLATIDPVEDEEEGEQDE